MAARNEQQAAERAMFLEFAEAVRLRVRSIESRKPREPDILCDIVGEGPVAFELGAVVSEALERATSEQRAVRRQFQSGSAALSADDRQRIEERLGGVPAVFVGFRPGTPPGHWRRAVWPVLEHLVAGAHTVGDERLRAGEVAVRRVAALSALLTDMAVRPVTTRKPFFGVGEAVEVVDATRSMLAKKFAGQYRSAAPIELLVYWTAAPAPPTAQWRDDIVAFIRAGRPTSPFRRVWCFDHYQRAAVVVEPKPETALR